MRTVSQYWLFILIYLHASTSSFAEDLFDYANRSYFPIKTGKYLSVNEIAESKSGLIWVAATSGLYTFDGHRLAHIDYFVSHNKELARSYIPTVVAGHDGTVWTSVAGKGLVIINESNRTLKHFQHNPENPRSLAHNTAHSIYPDEKKGAWIATNKGLDYFDRETEAFTHFTLPDKKSNKFNVIRKGSDETLLLGTQNGVFSFNIHSKEFDRIGSNNGEKLRNINVRDIYLDEHERIWIGSWEEGIFLISKTGEVSKIGEATLARSVQRVGDEVWFSSHASGIIVFDFETASPKRTETADKYRKGALNSNRVSTFYKDNNDLIWIGLWGDGVTRSTPLSRDFSRTFFYSPTIESPKFKEDFRSLQSMPGDEIWLGSLNQGIDVYSSSSGFNRSIQEGNSSGFPLMSSKVYRMAKANQGDLFISTLDKGLYRYRPHSLNNDPNVKSIHKWQAEACLDQNGLSPMGAVFLLPLPDGGMLAIHSKGLYIASNSKGACQLQEIKYGNTSHPINAALIDDNRVLLNSYSDFFIHELGSNSIEKIDYQMEGGEGVSKPTFIRTLRVGPELIVVHARSSASTFIFHESTDGVVLKKIENDNDSLYLYTSYKDRELWGYHGFWDKETNRIHKLGMADGVIPDIGAIIKHDWLDKDLIFSVPNGLAVFRIENYKKWLIDPNLLLQNAFIDGEKVKGNISSVTLAPDQKDLLLEFSALEMVEADKIRYRYMLEGHSEIWTNTTTEFRRAAYSSLPPGKYLFRLQSTNRIGEWTDKEITVAITVQPAWYQTYWFYALTTLLALAVLYGIYLLRLRVYRIRQFELEALVDERTHDLRETQEALFVSQKQASLGRLVSGVAHEINTPLGVAKMATSVVGMNSSELFQAFSMEKIEDKQVSSRLKKISDGMGLLNDNLDRLSGLVDSFKKISVDEGSWGFSKFNASELVRNLQNTFKDGLAEQSVRLELDCESEIVIHSSPVLWNDLLNELLSNALTHAFSKETVAPYIRVSLSVLNEADSDRKIILRVEDNGQGMNSELTEKVFDPFTAAQTSNLGLGLHVAVNNVSNVLGGSIECVSEPGGGCRFTVMLPASKTPS